MHTIRLNVKDSIYEHIMFLLKSLDTKELEIIEEKNSKESSKRLKRLNAISIKTNNFKFDREEANER